MLERLLAGQLSDDEQVRVERHLDECDSCCMTIESLTAETDWWKDASDLLQTVDRAASDSHGDSSRVRGSQRGTSRNAVIASHPLSKVESTVGDIPLDFLDASDSPAMLGSLGGYDIIEPIGCGGMGVVLKGYDRELNRFVAVKVLAPHYATSAAARKRFAREAQAAAAVVHPHVLAIHSVDATGRLPYLVMPLVCGESLQQRIERVGPLSIEEILRIGTQAASGLQAAHDQGLVHRDIKPGNILLERGIERVMLTDFGLARAVDDASMTRSGVIAGTPQYMSPEQARGDSIDHRSDLFSLGSVLYTMAAGRPPFRAESTMGLLNRIVETEPRPLRELSPSIPDWLGAIIRRLHAKSPSDRFVSAGELAELLEDCLAHVQQPDVSPLPLGLNMPARRRPLSRVLTAGLAGCGLVAAIGYGVFVWLEEQTNNVQTPDSAVTASDELAPEDTQGTEAIGSPFAASSQPEVGIGSNLEFGNEIEIGIPGDTEIDVELQSIEGALEALDAEISPFP